MNNNSEKENIIMKISVAKLYRPTLIILEIIEILLYLYLLWVYRHYNLIQYENLGYVSYILIIMLIYAFFVMIIFPMLLFIRRLTSVNIYENKCISYSFFKRKLCEVNLNEKVYLSYFYARFPRNPQMKFVAISNEEFKDTNDKQFSFFRKYDRSMIVFPYDEKTLTLIDKGNFVNSDNR